jgi:hypothetical protein
MGTNDGNNRLAAIDADLFRELQSWQLKQGLKAKSVNEIVYSLIASIPEVSSTEEKPYESHLCYVAERVVCDPRDSKRINKWKMIRVTARVFELLQLVQRRVHSKYELNVSIGEILTAWVLMSTEFDACSKLGLGNLNYLVKRLNDECAVVKMVSIYQ